ncbi:MAG TPA: hypothetical protein VKE93_02755 [Candidatus Angelobacter sp.]|nr:hypothetical protein [Candidatus Angelobacter sp.]
MPSLAAKVKEEVRKMLVVAVFFAIGFCIILVHNRLLTRGSGIELASFTRAMIGGLIVAKVLLTVNLLPFVHAFPNKPLIQNITWKTSLYVVASIIFLYIEPFLKSLVKGMGIFASHSRAWQELMLPRTWATVIWLGVLMAVFVTMQELSRVLGNEQMKHIFLGERRKPVTEIRSRKAA